MKSNLLSERKPLSAGCHADVPRDRPWTVRRNHITSNQITSNRREKERNIFLHLGFSEISEKRVKHDDSAPKITITTNLAPQWPKSEPQSAQQAEPIKLYYYKHKPLKRRF